MDQLDGTDLTALHAAITATSATAFPGVHFEFYREDRVSLPFGDGAAGQDPRAYCLLNMAEMDASDFDPGTDQQALVAKFEAEFIIKALQDNSRILIRVLAGSYAAFLRKQMRWPGTLNGAIRVSGVYKDDFSPELDQFEVWKVEWLQEIWLGEGIEVFGPTLDQRPQQIFYSFAPLIGIPYKDEYKPL